MRIEAAATYPATTDEVARMLADPAFVRRRDAAAGALSSTAETEGDPAGAFVVRSTRSLPTDDVPQVARRLVGDTLELRQVDSWEAPGPDGARTGSMSLEVSGAPVRLSARLTLVPAGEGQATEAVQGDLVASVPLVGGKLEKAAEPAVQAAIRSEERVGREWLAGR